VFEVTVGLDGNLEAIKERVRTLATEGPLHGVGGYSPLGSDHDAIAESLGHDQAAFPGGPFAVIKMTVAREYLARLRDLDPPTLAAKLEQAADRVMRREMPRASGAFAVTFEGEPPAPVVRGVVSPRLSDGGQAPIMGRDLIRALEAGWDREVQRSFGLRREVDHVMGSPEAFEAWQKTYAEFTRALGERMGGRMTQGDFSRVMLDADAAQQRWKTTVTPQRNLASYELLSVTVERGDEFFSKFPHADIQAVVKMAARSVVGEGLVEATYFRRPGVLGVMMAVSKNRAGEGWREAAIARSTSQLAPELARLAKDFDSRNVGTVGELGRVSPVEARRRTDAPQVAQSAPTMATAPVEVRWRLPIAGRMLGAAPTEQMRGDIVRAAAERALAEMGGSLVPDSLVWVREGEQLSVRLSAALPQGANPTAQQSRFAANLYREISRRGLFSRHRAEKSRDAGDRVAPVAPVAGLHRAVSSALGHARGLTADPGAHVTAHAVAAAERVADAAVPGLGRAMGIVRQLPAMAEDPAPAMVNSAWNAVLALAPAPARVPLGLARRVTSGMTRE
jgi:hypothetical protein